MELEDKSLQPTGSAQTAHIPYLLLFGFFLINDFYNKDHWLPVHTQEYPHQCGRPTQGKQWGSCERKPARQDAESIKEFMVVGSN